MERVQRISRMVEGTTTAPVNRNDDVPVVQ